MAKDVEAPTCHDRPMRPIVYGYPGEELMEQAMRGEIALGGCCIDEAMPRWSCPVCGRTEGFILGWDEHMADDDW